LQWDRREFMQALGMLGLSCSSTGLEVDMAGIPPWHLWGGDKVLNIEANALGNTPRVVTSQIAKISYGRPDTWRFFLYASLGETDATGGAIYLFWRIAIGVGRTAVEMSTFDFWTFALPISPPFLNTRFCTSVQGPILAPVSQITTPPTNTPSLVASQTLPPANRIEVLPAQDIQAYVDVEAIGIGANKRASLTVAVLFSPNAHVRPEWTRGEYPGGEDAGH